MSNIKSLSSSAIVWRRIQRCLLQNRTTHRCPFMVIHSASIIPYVVRALVSSVAHFLYLQLSQVPFLLFSLSLSSLLPRTPSNPPTGVVLSFPDHDGSELRTCAPEDVGVAIGWGTPAEVRGAEALVAAAVGIQVTVAHCCVQVDE
jgi:hypothetical protein